MELIRRTAAGVSAAMLASVMLLAVCGVTPPARAQVVPGFVDAAAVVGGLVVDMRYYGEDNFVGARIDGYDWPRCLLTRQAASALAEVQRQLTSRRLGLKVFDCYRPARAVAHFVRWARDLGDIRRKRTFYPDVDKRDLFRLGYIAERSGHSRGSTVDLTLVRRAPGQTTGGLELDMGTPHDFFGPASWPSDTTVGPEARANRQRLADAMARGGFRPYDQEWWHFTLGNEPFPDTYFDFVVR
jgi:D-alanyl-D-alanine dipeptidase